MKDVSDSDGAVIYCRVASAKAGSMTACGTQEAACRDYAAAARLDVLGVFRDRTSGLVAERPGLNAMLGFLGERIPEKTVVIMTDPSRLARNLDAHDALLSAIGKVGGIVRGPTVDA